MPDANRAASAGFVLDALEQALHARRPVDGGLVHHSDRGVQEYVSIKYSERLAQADIEPSVGNVGDSYDNLWTPPASRRYVGGRRLGWTNLSGLLLERSRYGP